MRELCSDSPIPAGLRSTRDVGRTRGSRSFDLAALHHVSDEPLGVPCTSLRVHSPHPPSRGSPHLQDPSAERPAGLHHAHSLGRSPRRRRLARVTAPQLRLLTQAKSGSEQTRAPEDRHDRGREEGNKEQQHWVSARGISRQRSLPGLRSSGSRSPNSDSSLHFSQGIAEALHCVQRLEKAFIREGGSLASGNDVKGHVSRSPLLRSADQASSPAGEVGSITCGLLRAHSTDLNPHKFKVSSDGVIKTQQRKSPLGSRTLSPQVGENHGSEGRLDLAHSVLGSYMSVEESRGRSVPRAASSSTFPWAPQAVRRPGSSRLKPRINEHCSDVAMNSSKEVDAFDVAAEKALDEFRASLDQLARSDSDASPGVRYEK